MEHTALDFSTKNKPQSPVSSTSNDMLMSKIPAASNFFNLLHLAALAAAVNNEKNVDVSPLPPPSSRKRSPSPSTSADSSSSSSSSAAKRAKIVPEERKDDAYWERRRKNNDAAKRSRDNRRAKEENVALRAAFLDQENVQLRAQINILKNEIAKLHVLLMNKKL